MSQIFKQAAAVPPVVSGIQTLQGNSGGPVPPDVALNLFVIGNTGIDVVGDPLTNTLSIINPYFARDSVTTINANPTTCLTLNMGLLPGVFTVKGSLSAYDVTDDKGAGYFFEACFRTDGAIATVIGVQYGDIFEEPAMVTADFNIVSIGNNIVVQVIGIAATTIDWVAQLDFNQVD